MNQSHQQNKREITRLTRFWYKWVNQDHHKDCDCHFYILKKWSYGDKPIYIAQHYGYIGDEFEIECGSLPEAHKKLIEAIINMIKEEKEWGMQVMADKSQYDEVQIEQAEMILAFKL